LYYRFYHLFWKSTLKPPVIMWMVPKAMKPLTDVPAEVVMCLAWSLADGLVCSASGMLFTAMTEGKLWMVELGGFDLWWRRNDMIDNMMGAICDRLVDALVLGGSVGTKGSMMMAMVVASVLCG
jgi:hypothetical protein